MADVSMVGFQSPRVREKRLRRRCEILHAALRAFRDDSYHATKLDDIALQDRRHAPRDRQRDLVTQDDVLVPHLSRRDQMRRRRLLMVAGACGFVVSLVFVAPSLSDPVAQRVGSEACKDCHEREYQQYMVSAHGRTQKDSGALPSAVECETCHGPGSLHVAANGDEKAPGFNTVHRLDKVPPAEANKVCLTCHNTGEQFNWDNGMHARRDMACVQCHSMHSSKDPGHTKLLKTESTTTLCATCHRERKLTTQKSAHMPMREGEMDCASCHNPHGTPTPRMLRANTVNELCTSCHADRRGPFLWEHPPVRENCLTCHDPHGSNNDKLLVSRRPYLCQRCHIASGHPSTLYSAARLTNNRLENRSCQNCHSQIHGSNSPSGRDFTR